MAVVQVAVERCNGVGSACGRSDSAAVECDSESGSGVVRDQAVAVDVVVDGVRVIRRMFVSDRAMEHSGQWVEIVWEAVEGGW